MKTPAQIILSAIIFGLLITLSAQSFASGNAPSFNVPTDAGDIKLEELRGQVVYVDFWASWCAPCRKSFPWLNEMQAKYGDQGLTIIGINVDKDRKLAENFLKKNPAKFKMVFDPDGELASKYKLVGMPSAYLIDKTGKIQHSHIGFRASKKQSYEDSIQHLINN